jgi:hypothetical protein
MQASPETLRLFQPACSHNQVPSHLLRHSESAGPVLGTEYSANQAHVDQGQRIQRREDPFQDIGGQGQQSTVATRRLPGGPSTIGLAGRGLLSRSLTFCVRHAVAFCHRLPTAPAAKAETTC